MPSPSALDELRDLLDPTATSRSCSPAAPDSCSDLEPAQPCDISQEAAEALFAAVEAKAVLLHAQARLAEATARLDELVAAGLMPEKNLPVVNGFNLYRQEGRASWIYPAAIKELEKEVKKRKQLAEQLGEATQKRGEPFWTIKEATPLEPNSTALRNQRSPL